VRAVVSAASVSQLQQISSSMVGAGDEFGNDIDFDGTTIVIGAPGTGSSGAVYIFQEDSGGEFTQQAQLHSPWGDIEDFGRAVAVDGDTIVAGAPDFSGDSTGAAVVYEASGGSWQKHNLYLPGGLEEGAFFGRSVDVDGDWVVVGAPHSETIENGRVYVYHDSGGSWSLDATLHGEPTMMDVNRFGQSVSLDGDTLAVGSPGRPAMGSNAHVHVFRRIGSSWNEVAEFERPSQYSGCFFGWNVALAGSDLIVGVPCFFSHNQDGGVLTYEEAGGTWSSDQGVYPQGESSSFGAEVHLGHDLLWVGAWLDDSGGSDAGSVSVFTRTGGTWSLLQEYVLAGLQSDDNFGAAVAAFGTEVVAGAPGTDYDGTNSGSAYLLALQGDLGEACVQDQDCVSGHCVDGVCCDTACGGNATDDCEACSVAAGAGDDGICDVLTGTSCNDGDPCTESDVCDQGTCSGDAKTCPPQDDCHEAGVCDPTTGDCSNPVAEDGTPCHGGDGTCQAGVCILPDGGTAGSGGSAGASGAAGSSGSGGGTAGSSGGTAGSGGGTSGAGGGSAGTSGAGATSGSGGTGASSGSGGGDAGTPSASADGDGTGVSGFYACAVGPHPSARAPFWPLALLALAWQLRRRRPRISETRRRTG